MTRDIEHLIACLHSVNSVLTADASIVDPARWTAIRQGWLHPSWPIEGHHSSTCVTALRSAHLLLLRQRQQEHRIHQRALWWNWLLRSISTSGAIGTAAASAEEEEEEASGVFCLVRDLSILRQELGMGSICYRQLIFHWWPQQGWGGRRGRKGKGKMGWWHGSCEALGGQSGERIAWSRKQVNVDATKGEQRREKFWAWRWSQ